MFNCQNTIERTIQSVLDQKDVDFEIILINDGSTDNTMSVVTRIKENNEKKIKLFSQKNKGVSAARNYGIFCSNSEYICFLDSDDIQEKNFLKKMVFHAENLRLDCTICKIQYNDKKNIDDIIGKIDFVEGNKKINQYVPELLKRNIFNSMVNKLYKKSIIDKYKIELNEKLRVGEDFDFNLKYVAKCYKIAVIYESLYIYKTENSFLTKEIRSNDFYNRVENINNLKKFYSTNKIDLSLDFQYVKLLYSDIYNEIRMNKGKREIKERINLLILEESLLNIDIKTRSIVDKILVFPVKQKNTNLIYFVAKFSFLFKNVRFLKRKQISI